MKLLLAFFVSLGLCGILGTQSASALGLKIAPLEYKTTLKEDEVQQGFIDISNPSGQAVTVRTSVQAFKQINNDGGLQFYDEGLVASGIKPELSTFDIGPHEALRMFFTINGTTLPEGDVYAAIFFTTEPAQQANGVGQLVRVGTVLSIVNKTPGSRKAEVTGISLPPLQLSDTVSGTYKIKNTGPAASGFYPSVRVSAWPGGKPRQMESSLVFGGRERVNDFSYQTGIGIHLVEISYGNSKKSQWVITLAPWMLVALLLIILIVGIELLLLKRRRKTRPKKTHKKPVSKPASTPED